MYTTKGIGEKMNKMIEKDEQGNWALKGVRWQQLHAGQVISNEMQRRLYAALAKLKDYEETGKSPDEVQQLIDQNS